jgi:alcohol dehydrogenase
MTLGSFFMIPNIAVLDPRMTKTLPPHLTASTAMDAMTHACEAYTCLQKNPLSDTTALAAIQLISQNVIKAVKNPKNMEARLALAVGSNLAGMAFSNSIVALVHNLGHATGAICHVPHGTCMSIILPYGIEYNLHKVADISGELLYALAGPEVYASTRKKDRAAKTIQFIRDLNQKLHELTDGRHACSLNEIFGKNGEQMVPKDMIPVIAKAATYDGMKIMNPEEMTYEDNIMILEHAWEGTPLDLKKIKKGKKRIKF